LQDELPPDGQGADSKLEPFLPQAPDNGIVRRVIVRSRPEWSIQPWQVQPESDP